MPVSGATPITSTFERTHALQDRALVDQPEAPPHYHWTWSVTHRRASWNPGTPSRRRTFETESGARRYAKRLLRGHGDLSPVTAIVVERRLVGQWQTVQLELAS